MVNDLPLDTLQRELLSRVRDLHLFLLSSTPKGVSENSHLKLILQAASWRAWPEGKWPQMS